MPEPVRLVVWDLDETFWSGTLTEGAIQKKERAISALITLAKRGIISSICSKNDENSVQSILKEWGVWDYFVFPSVNWEPKGPRLAALIEAVQLRPETVLFIDDNPINRREAQHFVPGLQLADENVIPELLNCPSLKGKHDPDLTRLKQYKLLETRASDRAARGGDVREFLRGSGIRVRIEYDMEKHLDRAVELINRTNQLNFTKKRLPENVDEARQALWKDINHFYAHAGLVRVQDNYGDYGFVGFFLLESFVSTPNLKHFCFSCRTLGMNVETWLYRRLGRPGLQIVGNVLTDVTDESQEIDWITLAAGEEAADTSPNALGSTLVRGGCDLEAVAHYLRVQSNDLAGEFNAARFGMEIRRDHSVFLRYAVEGLSDSVSSAFHRLGYREEDFNSALVRLQNRPLWLLSFWADAAFPVYRHRASGALIPFAPAGLGHHNVLEIPADAHLDTEEAKAAYEWLKAEFVHEGTIGEHDFKENLRVTLKAAPNDARILISLADEIPWPAVPFFAERHARLNRWTREVTEGNANVTLLSIRDFIHDPSEVVDFNHFDRRVYHRLACKVVELGQAGTTSVAQSVSQVSASPTSDENPEKQIFSDAWDFLTNAQVPLNAPTVREPLAKRLLSKLFRGWRTSGGVPASLSSGGAPGMSAQVTQR